MKDRSLWGFLLGTLGGLAGYAAVHILPSPQNYMVLNQVVFSGIRTPPLLTFDPKIILLSVFGLAFALIEQFILLAPVLAWAIFALLKRRAAADRPLLVFSLCLSLSFAGLASYYTDFYMILITPAFSMLLAAYLLGFTGQGETRLHRLGNRAAWGLAIVQVLLFVMANLLPSRSYRDYRAVQERLGQSILAGDAIIGAQTYWFGLYDHRYYSWEILPYYRKRYPNSTLAEAFCRYRPDIFIRDGHVDQFITGNLIPGLHLPEQEMEAWLEDHATLLDSFDGGTYRQVSVYRLSWDEGCGPSAGGLPE